MPRCLPQTVATGIPFQLPNMLMLQKTPYYNRLCTSVLLMTRDFPLQSITFYNHKTKALTNLITKFSIFDLLNQQLVFALSRCDKINVPK